MWRQLLLSDQAWVRRSAERSLAQIDALDQIDQIQAIVSRSGLSVGTFDWPSLVSRGILRGVPVDPTGTPYLIDPAGRVRVSSASPLFPMPAETGNPR
jgi:hypothetical protein